MDIKNDIVRLHRAIYQHSGGLLGHRMMGTSMLLLTSIGRKTGKTRTSALVYATDGDRLLVVASNGGEHRPPAWLYNVRANPAVDVQVGASYQPMTARVISPEQPEYIDLWNKVNANNHDQYRGYARKTHRPIPVVVLEPR